MSKKRANEHGPPKPVVIEPGSPMTSSAVGYVRRSTDRQEQSIPDQKLAIERYASEHGMRLVNFYVDDAISGTSASGRRGFQQMLADAQTKGREWIAIVVYDVKRFGRVDNDEAGYYRHVLRTHGVEVCYVSEGFNGDETDDLLRPVKQWQARQESKDLSKVTIRGLLSKMSNPCGGAGAGSGRGGGGGGGAWMGGVPPLGYDLRYENDRGEFLFGLRYMADCSKQMLDQRGRLVRTLARGESVNTSKRDRAHLMLGDPARVAIVRRIFHMYSHEGRGLAAIADALNKQGVPTPRGPGWSSIYAGQWRDSTVRAILVNPLYMGDMVWNRRTDGRFHSIRGGLAVERKTPHGARLVPNAQQDWIVIPDAHPPIVDRRMFAQAQTVREERPGSRAQRGTKKCKGGDVEVVVGGWNGARARFLLSGLIRCGLCGNKYQGITKTKGRPRKDGSLVRNGYYGCGGYIAKGRSVCTFNAIGQEGLEAAVCRQVVALYQGYAGDAGRERLLHAVRTHLGLESRDIATARKRALAEQTRVESTIARLLDNMTPRTRDLVDERLAQLREKRDAAQLRVDELDRLASQESQVVETASEIWRFVHDLEFTLTHGVNDEKRTALRRAIAGIVVCDKQVSVRLRTLPLSAVTDKDVVTINLPQTPAAPEQF